MKKIMHSALGAVSIGCLAVVAVLFVGCGPTGDKKVDKDDIVLLKINNDPAITKTEFYTELRAMANQMDPALLPKPTQRKVLDDLARFKTIVAAAEKEGIDNDSEFVKAYNEQKRRLKEVALVRFYEKKKFDEITVSEEEKKNHFEQNKSKLVKEQGGALVSGVKFDNRDKALSFYEKAKKQNSVEDFASVGKKEKDGNYREFGRVSEEAGPYNMVPEDLKKAVLNLVKLPAVDVVKSGKETWVIYVSDRKDPVLFSYDEIEERIGNQLRVNKFMEKRNSLYDDLKKEFNVEFNEDFFSEVAQPGQVTQAEANASQAGNTPNA